MKNREILETLEDAEYMLRIARQWLGNDSFVRAQLNGSIQRIERVLETLIETDNSSPNK